MLLDGHLEVSRLGGFANKYALFWPHRRPCSGWRIMGFNWCPWVVRLWFRFDV